MENYNDFEGIETKGHKEINILGVNILFFICVVLFVTIGGYLQYREIFSGLLLTQLLVILLPAVIYLIYTKNSIIKTTRLNKITWNQGFLVIGIAITGYIVTIFLSSILNYLLSLLGDLYDSPIPDIKTVEQYITSMLIIAVSPAICEEFLYRGVIMRGYEKIGPWKAIVFSGLLFGLMHMNIQNFIAPILLGILFGYLVFRSNSILPGMIAHFIYNGLGITLAYSLSFNEIDAPPDMSLGQAVQAYVAFGMFALVAAGFLIWFIILYHRSTEKTGISMKLEPTQEKTKMRYSDFVPLIIPGGIILIMILAQLAHIMGLVNIQ